MIKFKNIKIYILFLAASFLFHGCFYIPQKVPNIKGVVVRDGKAVPGAAVKFLFLKCGKEKNKGKVKSKCKTGVDGSFNLAGKKGLGIIFPAPAEYIVCWKLCFYEGDGNIKCWDVESLFSGPQDFPEFMEIKCDLNSKNICEVIKTSDKYFRYQLAK